MRQARVALPACIVCVDAASVVAPGGAATESIAAAVAGGATAVLLADTGVTGTAQSAHNNFHACPICHIVVKNDI